MGLLIRALLIWLLALAVPAQGATAVTMAFCGPNHHGDGAAAQIQPDSIEAHSHIGVEAKTGHGATATMADEDGHAAAPSVAPVKATQADTHKCSACASCCSVSALLNTVLSVPAPELTTTVFAAVVTTVDAFATDGPDRPPRIVLA